MSYLTIEGTSFKINTIYDLSNAVFPAIVRPNIQYLGTGDTVQAPFNTPLYSALQLIVQTDKPIIPLYYGCNVFNANPTVTPLYAFSTPFIVSVRRNGAPAFLNGSVDSKKYALKIAPYAQRVVYTLRTGTANAKQFIGDINLLNFDMIGFSDSDFLTNAPLPLMPTDGQKWYLNYLESNNPPAAPNYDSTTLLSYGQAAGTYVREQSFMYAELD